MKIYTEEQVRDSLMRHQNASMFLSGDQIDYLISEITPIELPSESLCVNCDAEKSIHKICMDCIIKMGKDNIELPSDEEIKEYVKSTGYYGHCTQEYHEGIEEGAKYVINKIQGGNQ